MGYSFFEGPNDGATKLVEVNGATHRGIETKSGLGHMVSDQANLELGLSLGSQHHNRARRMVKYTLRNAT